MSTPLSPLISALDLSARLRQASERRHTRVVDCRFNLADTAAGRLAWQQGHIPGAVYAHLDQDLSGAKTGRNGRHPLPEGEAFARTLQRWGVQADTLVVAYDDAGGMFAARLWWMLKHWWGHARVVVLDGGWQAWQQAHAPVESASGTPASEPTPAHPSTAEPLPRSAVASEPVTYADVLASLQAGGPMQLIDARAADRFQGQNETLDPVGGHIPGALNRFFKLNLNESGGFKPADTLREEFTALLGSLGADCVVHQCGSGVTACHNLLAMDLAGLPGSRLYAGSWSEWCSDPARPVVCG